MNNTNWLTAFVYAYRLKYGENSLSDAFIDCMNVNLLEDFNKKTGINIKNTKNKIFLLFRPWQEYHPNETISEIQAGIGIFNYGMDVSIKWVNTSNNVIKPSDEIIDSPNFSMWFDCLNVKEIHEVWSNEKLPILPFDKEYFKFKLLVDHFSIDSTYLQFNLNNNDKFASEKIIKMLNDFIKQWNLESEENNRAKGVFHNSELKKIDNGFLEYYIDLGSASISGLEGLLKMLNKTDIIESVKITAYTD